MKPLFLVLLTALPALGQKTTQPTKKQTKPSMVNPEDQAKLAPAGNGPFGFEAGMKINQIKAVIGADKIKRDDDNLFTAVTAPKPHKSFKEYWLIVDSKIGLVKIIAISELIERDSYGNETRSQFEALSDSLISAYGSGEKLDYLKHDSIWGDNKYWTMGIYQKQRTLTRYWAEEIGSSLKNKIHAITLAVKAYGSDSTRLHLTYEFDGFDEFINNKKAKEDEAL